jgi:hypothetical protein
MRRILKVFGIGLPRTATSSLAVALARLGYRAVHNQMDFRTVQALIHGRIRCPETENYDAICDVALVRTFQQLDRSFPGSKFILTTRRTDAWLRSCRRQAASRFPLLNDLSIDDVVTLSLYGTIRFNYGLFRTCYEDHSIAVNEYFKGRADDLLNIDICAGQGWAELCQFLDEPIPTAVFPHVRPTPRRERVRVRDLVMTPRMRNRAERETIGAPSVINAGGFV